MNTPDVRTVFVQSPREGSQFISDSRNGDTFKIAQINNSLWIAGLGHRLLVFSPGKQLAAAILFGNARKIVAADDLRRRIAERYPTTRRPAVVIDSLTKSLKADPDPEAPVSRFGDHPWFSYRVNRLVEFFQFLLPENGYHHKGIYRRSDVSHFVSATLPVDWVASRAAQLRPEFRDLYMARHGFSR